MGHCWKLEGLKMPRTNYTYLNRIWKNTQDDPTVRGTYVAAFDMVNTISSVLSHKKCYNTLNVSLEQIRPEINFTDETFNQVCFIGCFA